MKKFRLLMVTLLMAVALVTNAQIAGYYVFSNSSGTYAPITGGTVHASGEFMDDDFFSNVNIGFTFNYAGTNKTQVSLSANGYIAFGATSSYDLSYTPISGSITTISGAISALGRNLESVDATSELRSQVIGVAPNRIYVVQWKNLQRYAYAGDVFNFQIRLYETTNLIEFVYGSFVSTTMTDPYYYPQVGLRGALNTNYKNRVTATNWAATLSGTANTDVCALTTGIVPANGQIYLFSPASCLPPTAPTATNVTLHTADLNWTSTATEWQIEYGLAGFAPGNGTRIFTTVKPYTLAGLTGGTNYTFYVRNICTPGDTSDWSSAVNFATVCDTVNVFPYTQGFESSVYPPVCWTSAKIGGTGTPGTFDRVTAGTYPTATPHNGTAMIRYLCSGSLSGYYPSGTNGIMATKALNLPNNNYAVSFWIYRDNGLPNNKDSVLIYINSNPNLIGATKLAKFHRCTTLSPVESTNGWYRYFVNLGPGSAGNGKYVIINAWSGNGANIYIDDITVDLAPTCYPPTALGVTSIMLHQANLTWTSTAAQWQVEYGAPNFVQGTGTKVIANANPFTLTGLAAATGYSYYVRAICAAGDTSLWNGPVSFATDCDSIRNFPYTESFDGTTFPPICWSTSASNWFDRQTAGTSPTCTPHSGAGMARFNSASYSTGNTGYLATKAIVMATDNYMVDFWMYRNSNSTSPDSLKVYLNWSPAPNGGTLLGKIPRYTSGTSGWYNIKLYFPAGSAGNGKYLVFEGKSGWGNNIFIDDVTLRKQPTCIEPVSASVSNILSSSADIDWVPYTSAPDWEIEWDTLGFTPGTGIKEYATAYPYTLNGLSPQTSYSFYIRAICSEGDTSARFGPVTFTTPCVSITTFPISESFDGTLFAPACWGNVKTAGSGSLWQRSTAGSYPTCAPHTGLGMAYFNSYSYSGTKVELISPAFDLPSDLYMVTFWMYRDAGYSTYHDSVAVYFNNAPNTTGATKLIRVNRYKGYAPIVTGADGWYKYKSYFPAGSAGEGKYVIFEGTSMAGNNIYIDDVVIEPMPTCPEPSNLKDTVLSGTKVKIDWTPFGTETQWRVEYGAPGFVQGTGMSFLTNHHPDTITGLNPASNYQFYVKAICSATDSSVSLGPLGFTTGCDTIRNLPYTNGFEIPTGVPNCWLTTNLSGTTLWSGATNLTGVPGPHSGTYFMGRYYTPSANSLLVTPIFKITTIATNPQLKVWVYRTTTGTNNINDSITFYCNTKPNLTGAQKLGMVHAKFNLTPVVAAAGWYQYTYNLPAAYNDSSFYVVTLGSTNHGTSSTGLGLDDLILQERPLCDSPINLVSSNVTSDSATISWTSGGTETQWQVEYGPTGFAHGAGTNVIVNTLPTVILTGLNSATTYDFYIRAICGVGDTSAWSNSSTFTTLCTAVTVFPYLEGFEGATFPPICWSTFQVVGPGTGLWIGVTSGSYPTCTPHTGSKMTEFNSFSYSSGTKGALVTRALNLPTNYYQVTFWMYRDDGYTGNHDSVTVYFNNAPNVTGATKLGGIPRYLGFAPTEAANGWYEYSFNFPAVSAGNNKYVIFEGYSRFGNNIFVDDVLIDVQPTCAKPTLLTVDSYTANSVTVSWTPSSGATLFNLEYGPAGYTPGTGTEINNVTNPYTITGLTEVTGYDFYVQDSCTASDVSLWAGPKGFTTDSACSKPTNIHLTALTPTSATIGWNGNATIFNIEYGIAGFVPGSGTIIHNITTNSYTINGLTANTNYDFYVQDSCSASAVSFWAGAFNFSTACVANSVFPFHEGFDTIVFAPPCWTYTLLSGSYGWLRSTAGTYPTCSPHSGVGMAEYNSFSISTGGRALLVSKPQNLPNDNYQVRFWMYRDNGYTTNPDRIEVRFNDSPDTAGSTLLGTINRTIGMAPVVAANGWYEYTFPFEAGSGGAGKYVIFEGISAYGNNIFVDDVYIETQPSCPKPTQVHVDTTTTTTATLSWTTHNATKWNLEYGPSGHAFGTGIMIHNITQNPYILTGLTPATSYDFYVQDSCLANDVSTWAGPVGFNTKCNGVISNYPYTEGFESSYFPPDCWDTLITNVAATWKSGAPGHNSSKCAYINYDYDTQDETLLSPTFDLTTNPEPVMDFWFNTSTSSPTLYDVYLKASTDGGATYPHLLWQKSTTNIYPSNTWTQRKVNLAPFDTCHKFKFKFEYTGNNGYAFSLDDVSIKIGNKLQIVYPHDTIKMCTMTTTDTLKMTIKNVGLNPIASGQKIKTFFKVNATAVVRDSITLTSTFNVGDSIKYKFPQTVDFSAPIAYFVGMLISYPDGIIWAGDTAQTWYKLTSFSFNPWTVDTIYTNGFPYTLHAGTGYVAYSWNSGAYSASESHVVNATGMQTVLVKQHYNCYGNDHVYVKDTSHTAIGEYTNDSRISIYPNPTNGNLFINLNDINENPDLSILTLHGQVVYTEKLVGNTTKQLDLSTYPKGVYFIKLVSDKVLKLERIVIH